MVGAARLQADLVGLLRATRAAEHDIFGALPDGVRDAGRTDGGWSPKDVQAHLGAWRAVEARRLDGATLPDDPAADAPIDEANAMLHGRTTAASWDAVTAIADASVEALAAAIERSSFDALCECDGTVAGIGVNGANHALGHLGEMADLAGVRGRWHAFATDVEAILRRGHIPPNDSGLLLYNLACDRALFGDLDEARRLLRAALSRRHNLLAVATDDPDLVALRDEVAGMGEQAVPV